MNVKLYQINLEKDTKSYAFRPLKVHSSTCSKYTMIDSSIYDCVFEGEVPSYNLEEIFIMFNNNSIEFSGRAMSVSDVLIIENNITGKNEAYFCDTIGFKHIMFDI